MDKIFSPGDCHGTDKLCDPRDQRCDRRTLYPHRRKSEPAIDKDCIHYDVQDHRHTADPRSLTCMLADFHHRQIALRQSGQQIRPACDPQIRGSRLNQYIFICKNSHQQFREKTACNKGQDGNGACQAKRQTENIVHCLFITLSPVLCAKDRYTGCDRRQKHVLNKLDLCRQRYCRHRVLLHTAEHDCIRYSHRCQQQVLKHDRNHQPHQLFVKFTCYFFLHKYPQYFSLSARQQSDSFSLFPLKYGYSLSAFSYAVPPFSLIFRQVSSDSWHSFSSFGKY